MSVSPYEENISLQPDFIRALSNGWRLEGQITFSFESDRYLDHAIKTTDQPASDDIQAILSGEPMLMPGNVLDASNSYMRGAVEAALKVISTYAQIDFQAEESGNAYLHFFTIDQLSNPSADTHTHGFGSYPKPDDTGAYAVFDTQLATNSADPEIDAGGVRDMVAVHEVLHNLGLYHPHDTDNQTIMLESSMDNTRFTVMSYNFYNASKTTPSFGFNVTPSPLDVAALQFLYGERANNEKDTSYNWLPQSGILDLSADGDNTVSVGRALYTIWDTGGEDTISFDAATGRSLINLNQAHLSDAISAEMQNDLAMLASTNLWTGLPDFVKGEITSTTNYFGGYLSGIFGSTGFDPGGFLIANKAIVENATGSSHDDILIGNAYDNKLVGGGGNDLIFGGHGNDRLLGGQGNDELRGGTGGDYLWGEDGNDVIWYGLDGDFASGGDGDDVFIYDHLIGPGSHATIHGGDGIDTLYLSQAYWENLTASDYHDFVLTGHLGGLYARSIEKLIIGEYGDPTSAVHNVATLADLFFRLGVGGVSSPNTVGTVEKATLFDTDANDRVVYKAEIPFSSNLTITGYTGSFDYMGTQALVMSLTHWADKIEVTLSLPTGFQYELDANNIAGFVQQNSIQIDYEYTEAVITDEGVIEYIIPATKYYTSFTGVQNSYDNGLTEIVGPDVVYVDRWLYDQSTGSTEIAFTHDSIEPGKQVYWLSSDTSDLLQIDSETGVVTTRSNLFRDGQPVFATIVASDGISQVTKDIEVRLDTTLEIAPEFYETSVSAEILPVVGWGAGYVIWTDGNYLENGHFTVEVVGETGSNPLFVMNYDGNTPSFVIARTPTPSEIGVTHQVKITVTDDTGQSDTAFMNVTIDPVEGTMEGTSGDDYLTPETWSERIWTINGGDGNDDLDTGQFNSRIGKTTLNGGDGNDKLTLSAESTKANGDAGDDDISLLADKTTANGGDGNDTIGSWGYDTLINGNDGDDTITVYYDRATINGGAGNDTIWINSGVDIVVDAGDGDDFIHSNGAATITGGAGADTIYTLTDTIVFNDISDSYLNNVSLTGNAGPEGLWDTIFGVNDDTIIDLSGLGEIEWAGSSTSSSSMLATILEGDNPDEAFFVIDADRDGGFDFGIELKYIQASTAIHFNGLSDWMM